MQTRVQVGAGETQEEHRKRTSGCTEEMRGKARGEGHRAADPWRGEGDAGDTRAE